MNTLHNFFEMGHNCPICDKTLTLYMSSNDIDYSTPDVCFKAECTDYESGLKIYKFVSNMDKKDSFILSYKDEVKIRFNSEKPAILDNKKVFFFYLCDNDALKPLEPSSYQISAVKACYYRSSAYMTVSNNTLVNKDDLTISSSKETFGFKNSSNNAHRIYLLIMNHEKNDTVLWYYTYTNEQLLDKNFKPNKLEKQLPYLSVRPDFGNRDKLISRLESWILMS